MIAIGRFPFRWILILAAFACATSSKTSPNSDGGEGASDAGVSSSDGGADGGFVHLVFILHLEGHDNGDSSQYAIYNSQIRTLMDTWEDAGAKISFETESVVTGVKESLVQGISLYGDNVLTEAVSRGHGVQLHGGLQMGVEATMDAFMVDLYSQRRLLQDAGINPVSVSNVCSSMDWTSAAADAGYLFVTSIVEYCGKSLPIEKQSASTQACTTPDTCHGQYPTDVNKRLRPWRANGPDWVTSVANGALGIIPSTYNLSCISEERADAGSYTGCTIDANDVAAYIAVLNDAVAMAAPGVVTAFTVVSSYGGHPTTSEFTYVAQILQAGRAYVDQGKARFSTTLEVYNALDAGP
ncbi:MAG: hypothetical protein HYY84_07680 [Deltaproteobacteria bacterium]|nr:hypothetical protein [Deltaproteobacteria bacterium]